MKLLQLSICLCLLELVILPAWAADEELYRHGSIPVRVGALTVEAGVTFTFQHASDPRVNNETLASLDIVSSIPTANGQWLIYVEGSTSPTENGVSTLLPEANQDAATAVDRDDKGRLQVSNLHYLQFLGQDALVVGLINPATPLDNSNVANNETTQFLATTLVNDPTIAFPDYTLGVVYFYKPPYAQLDLTFLLSSSNGLADNPDKSYAELVDVTAPGKGVFAVMEADWTTLLHTWRVGTWIQTADNAYLNGSGDTGNNYGVYLSADHQFGETRMNVRLGAANPVVSETAQFIGVALDHPVGDQYMGFGYTKSFVSDQAGPNTADRSQYEVYYRLRWNAHLSLTPSIQRIQNSNFDDSGATVDSNVYVYSLRGTYNF